MFREDLVFLFADARDLRTLIEEKRLSPVSIQEIPKTLSLRAQRLPWAYRNAKKDPDPL